MCNSLAIVWEVSRVKSSYKWSYKRNDFSKRFEILNQFEFTSGVMLTYSYRKAEGRKRKIEI